ncbi:MAG TPA: hypothetical protein VLI05_04740 [Candidatus Saccharimonadia bacterium]|nr:hypothetical protein [Candidatus Saccharimonadia bacterium]
MTDDWASPHAVPNTEPLPTLDDIAPEWVKPEGRLTKADRALRQEVDQRRAAAQALFNRIAELEGEVGRLKDLELAYEQLTQNYRQLTESSSERELRVYREQRLADLARRVQAELNFMMPDDEMSISDGLDERTRTTHCCTNSYGTFVVRMKPGDVYDAELHVTPTDKTCYPLSFDLDERGLLPRVATEIIGWLGLPDNERLPRRAAKVLRKPSRPDGAGGLAGLIMGMTRAATAPSRSCGAPYCPGHH